MPHFYVLSPIARGELVPVLAEFAPDDEPIWVVYPRRQHLLPKVSEFVKMLRVELPEALARSD